MELGLIGVERVGVGLALRILRGGHRVVMHDPAGADLDACAKAGATTVASPTEVINALTDPRVLWLTLPAGHAIEETIEAVVPRLAAGDILVDGGNSHFKDTIRRAKAVTARGVAYLDAGISGGIWGLAAGYCLMVGGDRAAFERIEPVLATLALENGYLHTGGSGSGHFTKMVHTGIEYGMMQAYAEGFEILKAADFQLDLSAIARLWNHGSVIRSWLLELTQHALEEDPGLEHIRGFVEDSGEGRWTVQQAIDTDVAAPVIALSLIQRLRSRQEDTFADRLLAAMRREFGGHAVRER